MPSDPAPNCAVTVNFYLASTSFSYYCTACSEGWAVQPDGSIYPPSRSRVIRLRLNAFPLQPGSSPVFAGFQISSTDRFPPENWTPTSELPPGVEITTPDGYPPPRGETPGPLTLDLSRAHHRLFYRLAVVVDGSGPYWDDPKIYDDGSE